MFFSKKLKSFKEINHCFFSRKSGYSKGLYKSLNCGRGSRDNKKNINRNLRYVSKKMNRKNNELVLMHQSHSNRVTHIKSNNRNNKINSDAMITKIKRIALGVVTADCVPILLYDHANGVVGCIHAGWKGAYSGIVEKTIYKIKKLNVKNEIYASVGPCIGKKNYEVDNKFFKKFINKSKKYRKYFTRKNEYKKLFNLRKFVADKLLRQKVIVDHINRDTFKDKNNFFSYRRSSILKQKDYGRCISVISLG